MKINNSNVEFSASLFALILKYAGLAVGAILICCSIYQLFGPTKELASTLLIYAIVTLIASLTIHLILMLLFNISLTFNRLYTKADNFTLDKIIASIEKISDDVKPQHVTSYIINGDKHSAGEEYKTAAAITASMAAGRGDEIDPTPMADDSDGYANVITLIKKGHIQMARHILITEKNLSLIKADSYINSIRK
ncbi:MAG: hypothetical protein R3Y16_06755 [Rikenellaceae bacterium]